MCVANVLSHILTLKALLHKWVALDTAILQSYPVRAVNNVDARQSIILDISSDGVHVS